MMGDFFKKMFQKFTKGKKVSRNYGKHMSEFAAEKFSSEFEKLHHEDLKADFYAFLTHITHSHRLKNEKS